MRIGIDIRSAASPSSGKGWYCHEIVKNMLRSGGKHEYILYTDRITDKLSSFHNSTIKFVDGKGFWWHWNVVRDWKKIGQDGVFFAPTSFIIPALLPKEYQSVITVHDLISFIFKGEHQWKAKIIEKITATRAFSRAKKIVVPSHSTKHDIVRLFGMNKEKIVVTPLGVDKRFFTSPDATVFHHLKNTHHIPAQYLLAVNGLQPRKNLALVMNIFPKIIKSHPHIKLVIVGGKEWKSKELEMKIKRHHAHVVWIERVSDQELRGLYAHATALIYPSKYEGFGLPVIEAMASGCPVISSNASSLKEVCGEAAMQFDPNSGDELLALIQKLLDDPALRERMKLGGIERARTFTWEQTAEATLKSILQKVE